MAGVDSVVEPAGHVTVWRRSQRLHPSGSKFTVTNRARASPASTCLPTRTACWACRHCLRAWTTSTSSLRPQPHLQYSDRGRRPNGAKASGQAVGVQRSEQGARRGDSERGRRGDGRGAGGDRHPREASGPEDPVRRVVDLVLQPSFTSHGPRIATDRCSRSTSRSSSRSTATRRSSTSSPTGAPITATCTCAAIRKRGASARRSG